MSKYIYLTAIQIFLSSILFSQTGPGGVGSSVNNVIWLDVNRETKFVINNPVDTLTDWSGNSNNFYYVNDANQRPLYKTNQVNARPTILFDGNNDRLRSPSISKLNNRANTSWFVVLRALTPNSSRIIVRSNYASNSTQWGTYHSTTDFVTHTRDSAGVAKSLTRAVTTTGFHIISTVVDSLNQILLGSYDGASLGIVSGANAIPTTHNSTWLGCNSTGGTYFFVGHVAELIVFNNSLNSAEKKIIENYLSAKYNITLSNDAYSYDSAFGYEVVGIGRDSINNEKKVAQGTGIVEMSTDSLEDGQFILFGHNNNSFLLNYLTQIDSIESRWNRVWRADVTGNPDPINLRFFGSGLNEFESNKEYVLLIDTVDGNFLKNNIVYYHSNNYDSLNQILEYSNVLIRKGWYFTLGIVGNKNSYTGPAGVGNRFNNLFWLDASSQTQYSNNQSVDTLFDISGNNFHFTNTTAYPKFLTSQLNGNPVLDFTNQFLKSDTIDRMNTRDMTWFVVGKADNNTHIGFMLGSHYAKSNLNEFSTNISTTGNIYRSSIRDIVGTGFSGEHGWVSGYQLISTNYNSLNQNLNLFMAGNPTDTVISSNNPQGHIKSVIGRFPQSAGYYFDGKIAEVILYNVSLNKTQRILVENYLSSKYNLSIANDKYGFEATHAQNLAGIGKIDNLDYHLRATGKGMVELSSENLDDETFVLFAHNTGSLSLDSSDIPSDIYGARVTRTWRVDISGNGAMGPPKPECNITYNLQSALFDSTNQYILLVDTIDSQFGNGGTVIYNGVYNEADSTVLFGNVILKDSCYYTIASRGAYLVQWTDTVNCLASENGTLEKTSGTNNVYNAGAASLNILKGGEYGWADYKIDQLGDKKIFGLAVFPNKNEADTLIEYGIEIYENGNIYKTELGNRTNIGSVSAGDVLRIERNGDTIYYKINGTTQSTKFANKEEDLILDASIYTLGGKFNPISVSFPAKPVGIIYAIPKKKLDASYYKTINGSLYVKYYDYYSTLKLKFNIYNQNNELVLKHYETFTPSNLDHYTHIKKDYGSNWIKISLNHDCPKYSAFVPGGYYVLEIFDDKGRPEYVRFKYLFVPHLINTCGGLSN